ncbi:MAG TPA: class I SAM-dependent methyltransferase [Bacteroidia bacterium]
MEKAEKTKGAVNLFNKYADKYQDKFMDVSLYHDTLDIFCNAIQKRGASILELACGPGNITKYLLDKRPDLQIHGTDLAPNMVELAKINNPTATFEIMDCREIYSVSKKYDALMCGFCFPYLPKEDAIKLISDAFNILSPGGVIYISTMEDDYDKSGMKAGSAGDELFMHYHEGSYLVEALEKTGFSMVELKRQNFPTTDESVVTDLILIAIK